MFDALVCLCSEFDVPSGLNPVPDEEVCQLYGGTYHVPLQQYSGFYGKVRRVLVMLRPIWLGTDGIFCGLGTSVIISSDQMDIVWN